MALIAIFGLSVSHAAVVKNPRIDKTPWELIEAIRATSQIRGFNGTWITGKCVFKYISKTVSSLVVNIFFTKTRNIFFIQNKNTHNLTLK